MRNTKNVSNYIFGRGSIGELPKLLNQRKKDKSDYVIFFIDEFFEKNGHLLGNLPISNIDEVFYVQTKEEPKTEFIDRYRDILVQKGKNRPVAVVAIGGGSTLDTGKAVANLLTNPGNAEDYQGWDLVQNPAIYKIGIPTISGTGAEASRTCVLTNSKTGIKLGMNSDFTIYDQLILDSNLTKSVPREQYFYTGMDTYIHCIESLNGNHRHPIGDAYSREAINLVREVFHGDDMMSDENRDKLMVASYLGGCAIANSYVGVIHPLSAGLSVVLGTHHCIGNCITMNVMEEFYPKEYQEFFEMAEKQGIEIPKGIAKNLSDKEYEKLYNSSIVHEKPLTNALGNDYRKILTKEKVIELFRRM